MTIPGYDPVDLEDELAAALADEGRAAYLTDAEWAAYEAGESRLVDLLDASDIRALLERREGAAP